ncbi:MAG: D-amino-acid dehydrogenase [Chloroflexota bacterium]|nr:D-amino-acid dehydrogenase [Chloroflexota bacterium]
MSGRVVVVGGGVVGLSCAYLLRRAGLDVTVVEMARTGQGTSKGNAGLITPVRAVPVPGPGVMSEGLRSLSRSGSPLYFKPSAMLALGPWLSQFARFCNRPAQQRGVAAMSRLASGVVPAYERLRQSGVGIDLHGLGLLYCFLDDRRIPGALEHLHSVATGDYRRPEVIEGDAMRTLEPALSPAVTAGFVLQEDRFVDPEQVTAALHRAATACGVDVREHETVQGFDVTDAAVRGVRTSDSVLPADHVVLAAGAWTGALTRSLGVRLPMQAAKGYSLAFRPVAMPTHSLFLHDARIAVTPLHDRLRLAGTLEFSGLNRYLDPRRVEAVARSSAPFFAGGLSGRTDEWVGMRPILPDGMPAIGPLRRYPNVVVAAGHSNLGMTLGPATAELVTQHITTGRTPAGFEAFSPARFGA